MSGFTVPPNSPRLVDEAILKSSIRAAPSVPSAKYQISWRFDGPCR